MKIKKRPVLLIGFMGAGKSTVGQALSKRNQCSFIDLDQYISKCEKRTIPEIFEQDGELGFRLYEFQYLKQALKNYDIIATGGGIISFDQTFNFLKTVDADIIWLDAPFPDLYQRIKNDSNRPNVKSKDARAVKHLYSSRLSRYNEIAFIKITTKETLTQTLSEIENVLFANDQY
ncbi:shikimate kinase [Staphylococcus americanisciuri]|uniref:Shikimate kinase n=1 Tax=Staphylococcus americanisciuri TaxID=2973940 RepID=A0ABT2F0Y8_9STAP|nr:shikimate kinase [Staphylococcus americanisciuri]MCS4485520.1 shikimate kinase [Staphylococcus americanisciuri]